VYGIERRTGIEAVGILLAAVFDVWFFVTLRERGRSEDKDASSRRRRPLARRQLTIHTSRCSHRPGSAQSRRHGRCQPCVNALLHVSAIAIVTFLSLSAGRHTSQCCDHLCPRTCLCRELLRLRGSLASRAWPCRRQHPSSDPGSSQCIQIRPPSTTIGLVATTVQCSTRGSNAPPISLALHLDEEATKGIIPQTHVLACCAAPGFS
jgi:hypothetical protein